MSPSDGDLIRSAVVVVNIIVDADEKPAGVIGSCVYAVTRADIADAGFPPVGAAQFGNNRPDAFAWERIIGSVGDGLAIAFGTSAATAAESDLACRRYFHRYIGS